MDQSDYPTGRKIKKADHSYFKQIFDTYDTNNSGYIELKELQELIKNNDYVSEKLTKKILKISDADRDGKINYEEFVNMLQDGRLKDQFGRYMNRYMQFLLPPRRRRRQKVTTRVRRSVMYAEESELDGEMYGLQAVATAETFDEVEGVYEEQYTCCPPPFAMFLVSIIEFTCFIIDEVNQKDSTKTGSGVTAKIFIYDPRKRDEFWRFLTYMFVHIGYFHLLVNLGVQLLLGVPLEMVHKWWRILLVYFAGVVAGSLATSITDPTSYLAGASGGVYAIMTAHIATIIMNWNEMTFPAAILAMFLLITVTDVGTSIYNRYWLDINDRIGYAAHFAGGLAGLLVGIWVLKNFVPSKKETYLWWSALVLYVLLMAIMVVLNVVLTDHFLK